jgi:hypothetical protein
MTPRQRADGDESSFERHHGVHPIAPRLISRPPPLAKGSQSARPRALAVGTGIERHIPDGATSQAGFRGTPVVRRIHGPETPSPQCVRRAIGTAAKTSIAGFTPVPRPAAARCQSRVRGKGTPPSSIRGRARYAPGGTSCFSVVLTSTTAGSATPPGAMKIGAPKGRWRVARGACLFPTSHRRWWRVAGVICMPVRRVAAAGGTTRHAWRRPFPSSSGVRYVTGDVAARSSHGLRLPPPSRAWCCCRSCGRSSPPRDPCTAWRSGLPSCYPGYLATSRW